MCVGDIMGRRAESEWGGSSPALAAARERGDVDRHFQKKLLVTRSLIDRLGLEKELHGHMGCVNCLEWNSEGSVLASASDDLHVMLWDPFRYKQLYNIATGHSGNIFSVKFLSQSVVATCAADSTVRVREVSGGGDTPLLVCSCHCGRVKRIATAPDNPHLMWSAGEDGLILQHDLRVPHTCDSDSPNVLVNLLNHLGRYAEAKCVAVNPRRPEQLAVGANDFYVRLYDTRMIKLSSLHVGNVGNSDTSSARLMWERQHVRCTRAGHGDPDNNIPRAAVQYFAPGHLSMEPNEHTFPKKATTYVAFSHDGNELLVNMGSEQVYLFDINTARRPVLLESFIIEHNHGRRRNAEGDSKCAGDDPRNGTNGTVDAAPYPLPDDVRQLKETANEHVNKNNYVAAVELYGSAIARCPDCAILYSNRAAALMRRAWAGDTYAAVRDCYRAIRLDPAHVKSHFRLAKALMDMRRAREAHECLLYFKDKFPRHANSHAVFLLQKDINVALQNMETQPDEGDWPQHLKTMSLDAEELSSDGDESQATSTLERQLRSAALDYSQRFLGHCNTTTDIKEANFLGPGADFVAAGSDDGNLFVWCRRSGNVARCLRGDESIVNCVQMHPTTFLVATSGIEAVVRLWSPRPEGDAGAAEPRLVDESARIATLNQQRMRSDPFEAMLLNISFAGGADRDSQRDLHSPACRAS